MTLVDTAAVEETALDPDFGKGRPWLGRDLPRRFDSFGPAASLTEAEINDLILDYQDRLDLAREWEERLRTADPTPSKSRFKDAQGRRRVCAGQIEGYKQELVRREERPLLVKASAPKMQLAPDRKAPFGYQERAFKLTLDLVVNCRVPIGSGDPPLTLEQEVRQVRDVIEHLINSFRGQLSSEPGVTDSLVKSACAYIYEGPFVDGTLSPYQLGKKTLQFSQVDGDYSPACRIQKPRVLEPTKKPRGRTAAVR